MPLALTMGEPAGIGPDITLLAFARRAAAGLPPFVLVAAPSLMEERARLLGLSVEIAQVASAAQAIAAFPRALPVLPLALPATPRPGHPDLPNGPATLASIEHAVGLISAGEASAVVTNPIAKHVLYEAGFSHPGHTELLAELAGRRWGGTPTPVMMLASEELRVVPVTVHVPLAEVARRLTPGLILETGRIVARDLRSRFGLAAPRLAVAGLNPHAGEGGAMGREDIEVIAPAIEALRAEGIATTGPHPADTLFHAEARARYDAALCMYHDQALIPLKTLAFDRGVNVTLGLPFVRTSPDHGTAFDIAGTRRARPDSLIEALKLAARLATADGCAPP